MAAAKDDGGSGEMAAGNGRRLHLGIPEAVFVVRDPLVLGILLGRDFFLPSPRTGLNFRWMELRAKGPGRALCTLSPAGSAV